MDEIGLEPNFFYTRTGREEVAKKGKENKDMRLDLRE